MEPTVTTTASDPPPNPAATATRQSSASFNLNYLTSLEGILKIAEFVFGLICWAVLAAAWNGFTPTPPHQFVLFVAITSWILTLITLVIYLFGIHANACSGAPWSIIEFCNNALWALMYFIAACVLAAFTYGGNSYAVASTVFAFFTAICYIVHTFVSFKEWRGAYPWN